MLMTICIAKTPLPADAVAFIRFPWHGWTRTVVFLQTRFYHFFFFFAVQADAKKRPPKLAVCEKAIEIYFDFNLPVLEKIVSRQFAFWC